VPSGRAVRAFLEQAVREEKAKDPPFVACLADHLDADPREVPKLTEQFSVIEHPHAQASKAAWVSGENRLGRSTAEIPRASSTIPATSRRTGSPNRLP